MFYYFGATRGALYRVMGAEDIASTWDGGQCHRKSWRGPPQRRPESGDYLGRGDSELKRITLPCHLT